MTHIEVLCQCQLRHCRDSLGWGGAIDHLRYAVTDGPEGSVTIALPTSRAAALEIKAVYNHMFWCSRGIGGCGARLQVAAGQIRVPHFRHRAGELGGCAFELSPRQAEQSYKHLAAQQALLAWIQGQGSEAIIEFPVVGGRADLHVIIDGFRHSLEVQLSPKSDQEWMRRDTLYRRHFDVVSWLFGDDLGTRATEDLLRQDVSFHIYVESDLEVAVGTRFIDGQIAWDDLSDCRLTSSGLWTPHSDQAIAATKKWRMLSVAARAMRDHLDSRWKQEANARGRGLREDLDRRRQVTHQLPLMDWREIAASVRLPSQTRYPWTHAARMALAKEASAWAPNVGWGWLDTVPPDLRPSAQLLAYYVGCIYESGTIDQLSFHDVPDPEGQQVAALVHSGLIVLYEVSGVQRWRRR